MNPHDHFIRSVFSGREESIAFFEAVLPSPVQSLLDLGKLEVIQESFLDSKGSESRTDKFYKIPTKTNNDVFLYLLFEHKSYYDPDIYTQLLKYLAEIYSWQKKNIGEYRIVIPFVFYHGEREWDLGKEFHSLFDLSNDMGSLVGYVPNFSLELYQLKTQDDEFPTDLLSLRLYIKILKSIRKEPDTFMIALRQIVQDLSQEKEEWKRLVVLKTFLNYMERARKDASKYHEIEFYKEVEGDYMTFLEELQHKAMEKGIEKGIEKGMEKGIEKGFQEGILKKALDGARMMLRKGYPIPEISEITGLSELELKENGIL